MKITYYQFSAELPTEQRDFAIHNIVGGKVAKALIETKEYPQKIECKKSVAKKLLKLYGGKAYTEYYDRTNKNVIQTIPIMLVNTSKLKELRAKTGLSQSALAEKLYVNQATICLWENYSAIPRKIYIKKLASILNCAEADFMTDIYEHIHTYTS